MKIKLRQLITNWIVVKLTSIRFYFLVKNRNLQAYDGNKYSVWLEQCLILMSCSCTESAKSQHHYLCRTHLSIGELLQCPCACRHSKALNGIQGLHLHTLQHHS